MAKSKTLTGQIDYILLATVVALLLFGLLVVYSATFREPIRDKAGSQVLWVVLGTVVALVVYRLPYSLWRVLALPGMLLTLGLLIANLLLGQIVFGARRTLIRDSVQPGVIARLVTVVYIAAWLSGRGEHLNKIALGLVPFSAILGVVSVFVIVQPDLSTALLIILTGLAMFFFAGGDPAHIGLAILIGAPFGVLAALLIAPERLNEFVVGWQNPELMDDHLALALNAIGSGGLIGSGFGTGPIKYGHLPAVHTDSVFAVVCEELGLLGALIVLGLYVVFAYRGYRTALETPDPFGSLIAFGATTMIVFEALLNMLVITGLVPFTGTALPFFTYGGTEMLMTMGGVGLILVVSGGHRKGETYENMVRGWRDWRARLSSSRRRAGAADRRA